MSRKSKYLAPHTSEPRDVPRCGALSLLQKTPHYRGDPAETAATLNVKLCDLTICVTACLMTGGILPRFFAQSFTRKLKADEERAIRGVIRVYRGCWCVLLYFAPCRPLPRPRRP
jgi:hypothetical protein